MAHLVGEGLEAREQRCRVKHRRKPDITPLQLMVAVSDSAMWRTSNLLMEPIKVKNVDSFMLLYMHASPSQHKYALYALYVCKYVLVQINVLYIDAVIHVCNAIMSNNVLCAKGVHKDIIQPRPIQHIRDGWT